MPGYGAVNLYYLVSLEHREMNAKAKTGLSRIMKKVSRMSTKLSEIQREMSRKRLKLSRMPKQKLNCLKPGVTCPE